MRESWVRKAAVAGRFYPAAAAELTAAVTAFLRAESAEAAPAPGLMAPHAGYVYSGAVAGRAFAAVEVPERVVVLCPNHTGRGARISVWAQGSYRLPGGDVPIDEELAALILREVPDARADRDAHRYEHAIEVELPFLQARQSRLHIVPIVLASLDAAEAIALGEGIFRAARRVGGPVQLIASSDMSHYLPDEQARQIDRVALEPLLALEPAELHRVVCEHDISMCGYVPATAMLAYARAAGARTPELVDYRTSGEAFGDYSRVVGYAGVVVR